MNGKTERYAFLSSWNDWRREDLEVRLRDNQEAQARWREILKADAAVVEAAKQGHSSRSLKRARECMCDHQAILHSLCVESHRLHVELERIRAAEVRSEYARTQEAT